MRAAENSRGKALIAIIAVAGLLLVAWFLSRAVEDRPASASQPAAASAMNDMATQPAVAPWVDEADPGIASNLPVRDPTPPTRSADVTNGAQGEALALAVDRNSAPATDPLIGNPGRARPRVAAECWGVRGSAPVDFAVTLDREVRTSGTASALISSRRDTAGYVTMFQTAAAGPVRGKRVEFTVDLRTRGATRGANLLLRAEDERGTTVAFDNMTTSYDADRRPDRLINRGVTGDTEWSTQHVVVDIPDEARVITYGVSVFGAGKAWIDNARIEVVPEDMATTAIDVRQSPTPPYGIPINPASLGRSPRNLEFDLETHAGAPPCN